MCTREAVTLDREGSTNKGTPLSTGTDLHPKRRVSYVVVVVEVVVVKVFLDLF